MVWMNKSESTNAGDEVLDRAKGVKRSVTIEPVIMLVGFCATLTGSVTVNLLETRFCQQELHLDELNCSHPLSDDVEKFVQPHTANLLMMISLVRGVGPPLLSLFIGAWSDQNGRKPFLIIYLIGYSCSNLTWALISSFQELHTNFFLIAPVLMAISSDGLAFGTCCSCYISDVSTEKNRSFRLTIVQSSSFVGSSLGFILAPQIVNYYKGLGGYQIIFSLGFLCCSVSAIYVAFFLPETVHVREDRDRRLFKMAHIKDIFSVVLKKRVGYSRGIIISLIASHFLMNCIFSGEGNVKFLALKRAYSWELEDYNLYAAIYDVTSIFLTVINMFILRKLLRVPDVWISIIGAASWCTAVSLYALSSSSLQFCLFSLFGIVADVHGPAVSSTLSRSVSQKDLGKVFAFQGAVSSLSPFVGPVLYTSVYNSLYLIKPMGMYFVSSGISSLQLLLMLIVLMFEKKNVGISS